METLHPTKIVCVHDPAIDWPDSDTMKQYILHRLWEDVEPYIRKDVKPTIFYVRPIPRSVYDDYVAGLEGTPRGFAKAFEAGCVRVENAYRPDGMIIPVLEMMDKPGDKLAKSENVDLFDPASRYEVGNHIEQISFLHPRISRQYTVPHTSAVAWTIQGFQFAAENQISAQTKSNENPSSETPASTESKAESNAA